MRFIRYKFPSPLYMTGEGNRVSNLTDADHLMTLLKAALEKADATNSTLVAALLAECIDAAERARCAPVDPG